MEITAKQKFEAVFTYKTTSVGSNLVQFEVRFHILRFSRFKVRVLETY